MVTLMGIAIFGEWFASNDKLSCLHIQVYVMQGLLFKLDSHPNGRGLVTDGYECFASAIY